MRWSRATSWSWRESCRESCMVCLQDQRELNVRRVRPLDRSNSSLQMLRAWAGLTVCCLWSVWCGMEWQGVWVT